MNALLWSLQVLLALWNVIGGIYTFFHFEQLKGAWAADLPKPVWMALSVLQILSALGLVFPALAGAWPKCTPASAAYLALYALLGCALFAQYAGFPGLLWGVIPALLAAFVAYGRTMLKPF